jgi:hypothetical protein
MPEDDIEQHLCVAGFGSTYESYLTDQTKLNIQVPNTDSLYNKQLTSAVGKHKIAAVHQIIEEIREGAAVPPLFINVINAALKCAESV